MHWKTVCGDFPWRDSSPQIASVSTPDGFIKVALGLAAFWRDSGHHRISRGATCLWSFGISALEMASMARRSRRYCFFGLVWSGLFGCFDRWKQISWRSQPVWHVLKQQMTRKLGQSCDTDHLQIPGHFVKYRFQHRSIIRSYMFAFSAVGFWQRSFPPCIVFNPSVGSWRLWSAAWGRLPSGLKWARCWKGTDPSAMGEVGEMNLCQATQQTSEFQALSNSRGTSLVRLSSSCVRSNVCELRWNVHGLQTVSRSPVGVGSHSNTQQNV